MFEFGCAKIIHVGAQIPVQVASGEETRMPKQKDGSAVGMLVHVSWKVNLIDITK